MKPSTHCGEDGPGSAERSDTDEEKAKSEVNRFVYFAVGVAARWRPALWL